LGEKENERRREAERRREPERGERRKRKRRGERKRKRKPPLSFPSHQGHAPRVRGPEPLDPGPAQHCGPPAAPSDAAQSAVDELEENRVDFGGKESGGNGKRKRVFLRRGNERQRENSKKEKGRKLSPLLRSTRRNQG
jgi:hypothetical protein